jgi:hypothetical protein
MLPHPPPTVTSIRKDQISPYQLLSRQIPQQHVQQLSGSQNVVQSPPLTSMILFPRRFGRNIKAGITVEPVLGASATVVFR